MFSVPGNGTRERLYRKGVCGKEPQTVALMDLLLYAVRGGAIVNRSLREKGDTDSE